MLVITQFYDPEIFKINSAIDGLIKRDIAVDVVTTFPSYPTKSNFDKFDRRFFGLSGNADCKIHRVYSLPRHGGRLSAVVNALSFSTFSSLYIFFKLTNDFQKILVFCPSPYTVIVPGIVAKFKFKRDLLIWVLDIWPESFSAVSFIKNKYILAMIQSLTVRILRFASEILVLSESMRILMQDRVGSSCVSFKVLAPWVDQSILKLATMFRAEARNEKQAIGKRGELNILFTGNVGVAQDLANISDCLEGYAESHHIRIVLRIVGSGPCVSSVKQSMEQSQYVSYEIVRGSSELRDHFRWADVSLISLVGNSISEHIIPAKFVNYLAFGLPILGSISGETKNLIDEYKLGFCSNSGDYEEFQRCIDKIVNLSQREINEIRIRSFQLIEKRFDPESQIDRLSDSLKSRSECLNEIS